MAPVSSTVICLPCVFANAARAGAAADGDALEAATFALSVVSGTGVNVEFCIFL
jgi:hypothetical protein